LVRLPHCANQPINSNTIDLGTLGGLHSYAYGINETGGAIGCSCSLFGITTRQWKALVAISLLAQL
jgi:uncharacterized membrane protein